MPLATKGSRIFLRGQSQYWCQRTDQSLSDWALALTKGKKKAELEEDDETEPQGNELGQEQRRPARR